MASQGNSKLIQTKTKTKALAKTTNVVIVKTEWNADIIDALEAGCTQVLTAHKIAYQTIVVPGAVEIPFAINAHAKKKKKKAHAYIALACVIKGDTPHFDYVCQSITQGITTLNTQLAVPVIYGVLTVLTKKQALERVGGKHGHKGEEAAITAIKMITINNEL
jgi:6,7-dimethyl-8-ribityllumazine synthase